MSTKVIRFGLERGPRKRTSQPFAKLFVVYQGGQMIGAYPSLDLSIENAVRLKGEIVVRFPVDFVEIELPGREVYEGECQEEVYEYEGQEEVYGE